MKYFVEVGIGVGFFYALNALENIFPNCICLKWLQFFIGILIFGFCARFIYSNKTRFKHFENFLATKLSTLKKHKNNPNRNSDLILLWARNVENGFKTAYGKDISDGIFERFSHLEDLVYAKYQDKEAVDKTIDRYISFLETVKEDLTSYGLLQNFHSNDLKKFENEA